MSELKLRPSKNLKFRSPARKIELNFGAMNFSEQSSTTNARIDNSLARWWQIFSRFQLIALN